MKLNNSIGSIFNYIYGLDSLQRTHCRLTKMSAMHVDRNTIRPFVRFLTLDCTVQWLLHLCSCTNWKMLSGVTTPVGLYYVVIKLAAV